MTSLAIIVDYNCRDYSIVKKHYLSFISCHGEPSKIITEEDTKLVKRLSDEMDIPLEEHSLQKSTYIISERCTYMMVFKARNSSDIVDYIYEAREKSKQVYVVDITN